MHDAFEMAKTLEVHKKLWWSLFLLITDVLRAHRATLDIHECFGNVSDTWLGSLASISLGSIVLKQLSKPAAKFDLLSLEALSHNSLYCRVCLVVSAAAAGLACGASWAATAGQR